MSALAEGSLAELMLAAWLRGSRAVSCTPWAKRGRGMLLWQSDSRAVAAAACTISLRAPESEEGGAEREKERSYHTTECMLLNVSVLERLQITSSPECYKRCHMHTAATFALLDENNNGQQAGGQMCHQLICAVTQDKKQSQQVYSPRDIHSCKNIYSVRAQAYAFNMPAGFVTFFIFILKSSTLCGYEVTVIQRVQALQLAQRMPQALSHIVL